MKRFVLLAVIAVVLPCAHPARAQHDHGGGQSKTKVRKIYLDKNPRIVAYQLGRLSNEQLLLVPVATDDPKYRPVFEAILSRVGMSPSSREDALAGLVAISDSSPVQELITVISSVKGKDENAELTIRSLASMLLQQPRESLESAGAQLQELAESNSSLQATVGSAAMVSIGKADEAREAASQNAGLSAFLKSIPMVDPQQRNALAESVLAVALDSNRDAAIRSDAIEALASVTEGKASVFTSLAELLINSEDVRPAAIRTLLSVKPAERDARSGEKLTAWLVDFAESTPAAKRTEDFFVDAMQLVDQLLAASPGPKSRAFRARLRETVVRVVRIHTVEEEMRYDVPYFAVEAGRPVQIVLVNEDLMPHNLVIAKPGTLQAVAEAGFEAGTKGGLDGKQYVPVSEDVLYATSMIAARETERLTFTAPVEPGEYPYVCTFPRHWMRMYGVMVVVENLDQWNANPTEPTDPVGSNRSFIQKWTVADLATDLDQGVIGRTPAIGKRLFEEATCAGCHHAGDLKLGNVGPELDTLYARRKGDRRAVLREILEPSHRIDDAYAVQLFLTVDGDTVSGLVVEESKDTISILENPEAKEPTKLATEDIEQRVRTANSMMPKGLLDRFSKDEIMELMAFIESIQKEPQQP